VLLLGVVLELLDGTAWSLVLTRNLSARLIADGRKLDRTTSLWSISRLSAVDGSLTIGRTGSSTSAIFLSLTCVLILLLAGLPLLSDLLELFRSALGAVRLHGHMGIEMIQGSVSLFTPIPSALVHALDLLVSSSRALVLLGTWNGDK
jgi:hypothetical protein